MKITLLVMMILVSSSAIASEKDCKEIYLDQNGKTKVIGEFQANLKQCIKFANEIIEANKKNGWWQGSNIVMQHPDLGDSQLVFSYQPKQDLSVEANH